MNGSKSLIDHCIISDNLLNYANTSDVRDDIDNHSDHLPITMYLHISIPIKKIASYNTRLLPKPKWFCVNNEMLQKYQYELDQHLGHIPVSEFMCDHMHDNYKQCRTGIKGPGRELFDGGPILNNIELWGPCWTLVMH